MTVLGRRLGPSAGEPHGAGTTAPTHVPHTDLGTPRALPSEHTRGAPELPPQQIVWETLIAHAASAQQLREAHDRLMDRLAAMETPAQFDTVVLNSSDLPGVYTKELRERVQQPTLSLGVLNPNSINVYFSPTGTASPTARAFSVPPNAMLVLPISAQQVEVGCVPTDLGANTAVVFLWRYFTVQPAFLGKGA